MSPAVSNSLWAAIPLPALIIDAVDRIAEVSPSAEIFLNLSQKVLRGQPLLDRLIIDAPMETALARVRAHQSPVVIADAEVTTGERPPQTCALHLAPMPDMAGAVLMMITPREIADRLGRSMHVTSAAKSAIGMAEMLAHEIKNPLAGISGAAQLLAMNLSAEDLEMTDLIVEETRRIVKLLEQVEQFGNLSPPARRAINLHDALDRARRSALVGFGAKMRITEEYDPSLPATYADADQLMQVFLNLLKNASEAAGPAGGTIRLRTFYDHSLRRKRSDGSNAAVPLQIEIIDNGPGIPPEIAADIFEPFVSGRENGTGLGLALVSKIITDHEGWISVDSHPGRTVFRLSLPLAPQTAPEKESV